MLQGYTFPETALKDLKVIHRNFPNRDVSNQNASSLDIPANDVIAPVSYTHLTLPTICSV